MSPPPAERFAARIFVGPALRAQPDRRLVDLVRDGYDAAFEEIVRRYRKPLDRFAAGIVGGRSEDVTQARNERERLRAADAGFGPIAAAGYFALSQSVPTPTSTSSGGSRG